MENLKWQPQYLVQELWMRKRVCRMFDKRRRHPEEWPQRKEWRRHPAPWECSWKKAEMNSSSPSSSMSQEEMVPESEMQQALAEDRRRKAT